MKSLLVCTFFVLFNLLFFEAECANVLIVATAPFKRNQVVHQLIAQELMDRHHNVTIITSGPLGYFAPPELTEIDVGSLHEKYFAKLKPRTSLALKEPSIWDKLRREIAVADAYTEYTERIFSHGNLKKFLKQELHFDACVVESDYPAVVAIASRYNCVLIVTSADGWPGRYLSALGDNAYIPTKLNLYPDFFERLLSSYALLYERLYYDIKVVPEQDKIVKKYLGEGVPYLADIQRNTSVLLVNRDPVIDPVLPLAHTVIDISGIYTSRPKKFAHLGLHIHLNHSDEGAIIFNLGEHKKSVELPQKTRTLLTKAFSELLPYWVVWKWEKRELPDHPINVYIADWMSLYDALSYSTVKLLITGGDLNSIEEAISNHIPIVGIPLSHSHAVRLEKYLQYGIGKMLTFDNLTVEALNETVREVIENPVYKQNVIKLNEFLNDTALSGLETAVWWIEYAIRNNGTSQLKDANIDIPLYQYYLLDVVSFVLLVVCIVLYVLYKILAFCYRKLRKLFSRKTKEKKGKKD